MNFELRLAMRRYSPWILLIFLLPLLADPTASSVWDSNEAFYTQTPREMLERGDWLVPHFNGQPRLNKPPLSYWLVAVLYRLFGVSLACERWLLAALGVASVLLVYAIAQRLRDSATALLAAGIFATNFRFLVLSRRLLIDILMLTCILAGILCFLLWRERGRDLWLWLSAACFGLGFLAKGPAAWIGLVLVLAFSYWEDRGTSLRKGPWKSGLAILLAVSASWYLALAWREGWESVIDFFWRENLGRFSHLDYGPSRGKLYYVGVLLADFFPWSLLFAGAVGWKASRWKRLAPHERAADTLLLIWLGLWFLLFSLSRNKQEYYILPLYPAAAIWVADFALRVMAARWLSLAGGLVATALGCGLALLASQLFGASWLWWFPAGLTLCFGLLGWRRRWTAAAASLSLFFVALFLLFLPQLEAYRPVRTMAQQLRPRLQAPAATAGYLNLAAPSLRFYLDEPIVEVFDIEAAAELLDSGRPVFLIVQGGDWTALQHATQTELRVLEQRSRLIVTLRTLLQVLGSWGRPDRDHWLMPVFLVTNQTASTAKN